MFKIQLFLGAILCAILFSSLKLYSQDRSFEAIESQIEEIMAVFHTQGISIAVVENDEIIYSKGLGYRNVAEQLPVTANTLFPIGSVSKPMTSSLIGVYQGKGQLEVADKACQHIKDLQFYNEEMNQQIKIEDLLAHRSGIGEIDATHVFFPTDDLKLHLARLPYLKPKSEFRERFDYSNMGYAILGGVTETISGKTWAENMQEEIFDPLDMTRTNANLQALQADDNYALGYSVADDKILKVEYEDQHESVASGAINSTSLELANWVKMLLNRGKYKNQQIVTEGYLEAAFSEHIMLRGSFQFDQKSDLLADAYGYGWFVNQYQGLYRVHHEGNVSGFTASVNLYPYKNLGIIVLTNQGAANYLTKAVNDMILNHVLGLEQKPWQDYDIHIGEARIAVKELGPINQGKKPSHPLAAYCGRYQAAGYGTVEVSLTNDELMIQFPAFKMGLEHLHYNTFINRLINTTHQNTPSFYIQFLPDNQGQISDLTIAFAAEPTVFHRLE